MRKVEFFSSVRELETDFFQEQLADLFISHSVMQGRSEDALENPSLMTCEDEAIDFIETMLDYNEEKCVVKGFHGVFGDDDLVGMLADLRSGGCLHFVFNGVVKFKLEQPYLY